MNTNPNAKRILCFGDSNTMGCTSMGGHYDFDRFAANVRWTGILQNILGDAYEVIEEGLWGRSSVFDDPKRGKYFNGENYWLGSLYSHEPLDLAIFMLGTNDLKNRIDVTAEEIVNGISLLIRQLPETVPGLPVLVIAPPAPKEEIVEIIDPGNWVGSRKKSERLTGLLKIYAENTVDPEIFFLDANSFVEFSDLDGLHYTEDQHEIFGEVVAKKVKEILG